MRSNVVSPTSQRWSILVSVMFPSVNQGGSCHCRHSEWAFSDQEARDSGDDDGTGEVFVRGVSFCETACEGAADPSRTEGALAYTARFDPPLWMSEGGYSPRLQEGGNNRKLDIVHKNNTPAYYVGSWVVVS